MVVVNMKQKSVLRQEKSFTGDAITLFRRKMCLLELFFSFYCFLDVFDEKEYSLLHFPIILGDVKNVLQFTHFYNFVLIPSRKTKFSMAFCHSIVIKSLSFALELLRF